MTETPTGTPLHQVHLQGGAKRPPLATIQGHHEVVWLNSKYLTSAVYLGHCNASLSPLQKGNLPDSVDIKFPMPEPLGSKIRGPLEPFPPFVAIGRFHIPRAIRHPHRPLWPACNPSLAPAGPKIRTGFTVCAPAQARLMRTG